MHLIHLLYSLFTVGLTEIVDLLIGAGASVESRDSQGKTALLLAAEAGHVTTVSSLIQHGCQVNVKDNTYSQLTAVHITAQLGNYNVLATHVTAQVGFDSLCA